MTHHFSLDPHKVLGVSLEPTLDELDHAFREKSKKYHPDLGGDDWAFRIVMHSHQILKAKINALAETGPTSAQAHPATTNGTGADCESAKRGQSDAYNSRNTTSSSSVDPTESESPDFGRVDDISSRGSASSFADMKTIDVELIWIRFEFAGSQPSQSSTDTTLSVCMAISWPDALLLEQTTQFPGASEILHCVIEAFEHLRSRGSVLASRSRIEDGRFVAWLSYPDVIQGMMAFHTLRDVMTRHQMTARLRTRDELIPQEWQSQ
jgi:hypothetical protein